MLYKIRIGTFVHFGVILTIVLLNITGDVLAKDCLGQDQCSCAFDDGTKVMLNSIGNADGSPRFKDVQSDDGDKYSYNPCFPFSEGEDCSNAAACVLDKLGNGDTIGEAQTAQFKYADGNVIVGYSAGSGILSQTQVTLKCDLHACDPILQAKGSKGLQQYELTLTTVCACPDGCDENGPINCTSEASVGGFSVGSLILVIFFTFFLIYFVGGVVFMGAGKKARGKEMIPNVTFWSALPGLVKDGFLFTLKPCKRGGYGSK